MNRKKNKRVGDKFASGFSLVEVAVSAVIISVIAIALSYALHDTNRKTDTAKTTLTQHQVCKDILKLICKDIEDAESISKVFNVPLKYCFSNPAPVGVIYYVYDADMKTLTRYPAGSSEVVGKDIAYFNIVTETMVDEVTGDDNLQTLTIHLHTGPDSGGQQLQKTLYFRNDTVWADTSAP